MSVDLRDEYWWDFAYWSLNNLYWRWEMALLGSYQSNAIRNLKGGRRHTLAPLLFFENKVDNFVYKINPIRGCSFIRHISGLFRRINWIFLSISKLKGCSKTFNSLCTFLFCREKGVLCLKKKTKKKTSTILKMTVIPYL